MGFQVLHVDESGDFSSASQSEQLIVGGLAQRFALPSSRFRTAIERAIPGVPWPPHAAHLNQVCFRPALLLLEEHRDLTYAAPEPVRRATELFRAVPWAAELRQEAEQVGHALALNIPTLRRARTALLRHAPALHNQLRAGTHEDWRRVDQLLAQLTHDGATTVAAAGNPSVAATPTERYLALWRLLDVEVAQMDPRGAVLPARFGIAGQMVSVEQLRPFSGLVTSLLDYRNAPPGLVIADLLVNRLRRTLRTHRRHTREQHRAQWKRDGLPPLHLSFAGGPTP